MKLVNFLCCYFSLPFCFFRGGSFTDDRPDSSRPQTASSSRSDLVYSGRQQKSWKFDGYSSDNDVMPCVHFKAVFTLFWTTFRADNPIQCEQQRHINGTSHFHTSNIVPERLAERIQLSKSQSLFLNIYFCLIQIPVLAPTYSRIPVHTAPKCGTEAFRYVTLHYRDWRGADSLRQRNRAEITILMCEQKPFSVWFSYRRKSYPVQCEHSLKIFLHV